ncbi:hypothetical protein AgCh_028627 [Apium graveolens]
MDKIVQAIVIDVSRSGENRDKEPVEDEEVLIGSVGVNHHYQSLLFGFALMRDELKTTFEWVLGTWLEVVEGKAPLAIITDQDQAMAGAIQSQLPNTTHLLSSWHISNKFPENFSTYYAKDEFKGDFNNCIYHSLTEEIFEDRWEALILKYKLEDVVARLV